MTQGFAKTSTQASFAALGIFLLGITLVLYGLRLTVRATSNVSTKYDICIGGMGTPNINKSR
ncbi:MAG: hypothetical protein WCF06_01485 [Nitrososphaeraceae archaeon]